MRKCEVVGSPSINCPPNIFVVKENQLPRTITLFPDRDRIKEIEAILMLDFVVGDNA